MIGKVDEALNQVGFSSTGLTGTVLGMVPGTKAYDLDKTVDTIKANLGFSELQAMREASPTGGALGQVAIQELAMLQSTVASLDKGQSEENLRRALQQVRQHFQNWKNAVQQSQRRFRHNAQDRRLDTGSRSFTAALRQRRAATFSAAAGQGQLASDRRRGEATARLPVSRRLSAD